MAASDVPFYNSSRALGNNVKRLLMSKCSPTPFAFIETALQAAIKVAATDFSPDPREIYHAVTGETLFHSVSDAAVEGNLISPEGETFGSRFLFDIGRFAELSQFWLWVIGSSVDGLVDWSSMLLHTAGCGHPGSPYSASGGPYINAISDDGSPSGDDFSWTNGAGAAFAAPGRVDGAPANTSGPVHPYIMALVQFVDANDSPVETYSFLTLNVAFRDYATTVDSDKSNIEGEPAKLSNQVAYSARNYGNLRQGFIDLQSAYIGGGGLPLGEAFGDTKNWYAAGLSYYFKD